MRLRGEPVASSKHELAQNNMVDGSRPYEPSHFSSILYRFGSQFNFASGHNFIQDYRTTGTLSAHLTYSVPAASIASGSTNLDDAKAVVTATVLGTHEINLIGCRVIESVGRSLFSKEISVAKIVAKSLFQVYLQSGQK
jgi:hypothetical protein